MTVKPEWPESRNDRNAGMTGKLEWFETWNAGKAGRPATFAAPLYWRIGDTYWLRSEKRNSSYFFIRRALSITNEIRRLLQNACSWSNRLLIFLHCAELENKYHKKIACPFVYFRETRRDFFLFMYATLLHLPPLKFHCVRGRWDRTRDCCDFGIDSQTLYPLGEFSSTRPRNFVHLQYSGA